MEFFASAIETLKILVIALGAGLGVCSAVFLHIPDGGFAVQPENYRPKTVV